MAVDPFAEQQSDQLVVATPELITFGYQLAGPGSRFLAQLIDFPLQLAILLLAVLGGFALGGVIGNSQLAFIAALILGFIAVWGYFPISEAAWSGKTLGKFAFGLRVVGDQGEPIQFSQAMIRNLIRIVDFLPFLYGFGIITLFWNGRGKRLGDLAAGTVVVRERAPVRLSQLAGAAAAAPLPAEPAGERLAPVDAALIRQLDPELRRWLSGYAARRPSIDGWRRQVLAARLEPALRREVPEVVSARGVEGALDHLADLAARETSG